MEISVTNFLAPIGASVFKFCVHLQVGKVYCVNENKDANPYFTFFFNFLFSFCRSYIIHMDMFSVKDFSATTVKPRLFEVTGTAGILSNNR